MDLLHGLRHIPLEGIIALVIAAGFLGYRLGLAIGTARGRRNAGRDISRWNWK